MSVSSLILYVSLLTGTPCSQVFTDSVLLSNSKAKNESVFLKNFAETACKTDNPDLLWQVAFVESGFQFKLARINGKSINDYKLYTGQAAVRFVADLKKSQQNVNVDIGVMQVNWLSHGKNFSKNPVAMMIPENQIKYLVDEMVEPLVKKCGANWVGCYHSWKNGQQSREYRKKVENAGPELKKRLKEVYALRSRDNKELKIDAFNLKKKQKESQHNSILDSIY